MAKLVAPDGGVKGVDVERPDGSKRSYDVQKDGTISVDNARDARQLKREGFFDSARASFGTLKGYPCTGCGFNSVFKIYKCWKCGVENGNSNNADQASAD
jgi:hypothetical protein